MFPLRDQQACHCRQDRGLAGAARAEDECIVARLVHDRFVGRAEYGAAHVVECGICIVGEGGEMRERKVVGGRGEGGEGPGGGGGGGEGVLGLG